MPARALRRYKVSPAGLGAWTPVMPAVVPNNRALVIGKILVSTTNASAVKFALSVGNAAAPRPITDSQYVGPGDEYTNGGIILIAGDQFEVYQYDGTVGTLFVAVFGEEVDN